MQYYINTLQFDVVLDRILWFSFRFLFSQQSLIKLNRETAVCTRTESFRIKKIIIKGVPHRPLSVVLIQLGVAGEHTHTHIHTLNTETQERKHAVLICIVRKGKWTSGNWCYVPAGVQGKDGNPSWKKNVQGGTYTHHLHTSHTLSLMTMKHIFPFTTITFLSMKDREG